MCKTFVVITVAFVLAVPATSRAEEPAEPEAAMHGLRLKLGAGVGYGIPLGYIAKEEKLSNLYLGEIPIELEASYRLTHAISAGVYAGYGFGLVSSSEIDGVKTSDEVDSIGSWRLGAELEYEFPEVGPAHFFTALRTGYVMEKIKLSDGGTDRASGWEYVTLMGGSDFEVTERFAFGPFVGFSLGQYTMENLDGASKERIPSGERALHEWLNIGVRGVFMP